MVTVTVTTASTIMVTVMSLVIVAAVSITAVIVTSVIVTAAVTVPRIDVTSTVVRPSELGGELAVNTAVSTLRRVAALSRLPARRAVSGRREQRRAW
eukprot:3337115-Rhodomonas_salina.2